MSNETLPITLSDLSPATRDWLLAKSARLGITPIEALHKTLQTIALLELEKSTKGSEQ